MPKSTKLREVSGPEIRLLYQTNRAEWKEICLSRWKIGARFNSASLLAFLQELCPDTTELGRAQRDEICSVAHLLYKEKLPLQYVIDQIASIEEERQRLDICNFYMERPKDESPHYAAELFFEIINIMDPHELSAIASSATGLQALERRLLETPHDHTMLAVKLSHFSDLDSPLASRLSTEQRAVLRETNTGLWFGEPLWKRINVGLKRKALWAVADDDANLTTVLSLVQTKRKEVEETFRQRLQAVKKTKSKLDMNFSDDITLMDFPLE